MHRLTILPLLLLGATVAAQGTYTAEHLAHSDVTPKLEDPEWDFLERHESGHMDVPRMREGGLDAEFFSIYMGETPGDGTATKRAVRRMDALLETVRRHPDVLEVALTAADVRRIRKAGRIACLMGVEGGHMIEGDLAVLRTLQRLGARYLTLTHSFHLPWADSAGTGADPGPGIGGLNDFGRGVVRELNRLGVMVDVSHVSDATFWDVIEEASAPVVATHSSADAVFDHRRNLSDDMLRAIAKTGGVVMVNFFCGYIDPDWDERAAAWRDGRETALQVATDEHGLKPADVRAFRREWAREHPMPRSPLVVLARHVEHVAATIGWDRVGIGADWDGVPALPEGIDHCGDLPKLTALLLARGASEDQLRGFLGENLLRAMEGCERRAAELATGDAATPR